MEILSLQRVDGGFDASKEIVECLGLELKTIRKLASTLELQTSGDRLRVLFAAILLEVLEVHFQAEKATWEAVVEKSNAWLDRIIHEAKPKVEGKDLLLWVKEFVDGRVAMERSIG